MEEGMASASVLQYAGWRQLAYHERQQLQRGLKLQVGDGCIQSIPDCRCSAVPCVPREQQEPWAAVFSARPQHLQQTAAYQSAHEIRRRIQDI